MSDWPEDNHFLDQWPASRQESYRSAGARALQRYHDEHPECEVWNERDGWHDQVQLRPTAQPMPQAPVDGEQPDG